MTKNNEKNRNFWELIVYFFQFSKRADQEELLWEINLKKLDDVHLSLLYSNNQKYLKYASIISNLFKRSFYVILGGSLISMFIGVFKAFYLSKAKQYNPSHTQIVYSFLSLMFLMASILIVLVALYVYMVKVSTKLEGRQVKLDRLYSKKGDSK